MSKLSFTHPGQLDLPVEVFDSELRLVGRSLSSHSLTVDAGSYFIEARLPDGTQLQRSIEVGRDEIREISLGEQLLRDNLPETEGPRWRYAAEAPKQFADQAPIGELMMYRLDGLGGWREVEQHAVHAGEDRWLLELPFSEVDALGFERPGGRTTWIPLPGGAPSLMRFEIVAREPLTAPELTARPASDSASALLGYLNLDLLEEAELLTHSGQVEAELLLLEKVVDPIAATVGALALLRVNELERLHDWTGNLAEWFPWLPDGAALCAEHLARTGQHEKAVEMLLEIPRRGLPVFSLSLTYAVDRLRGYTTHQPANRRLERTLTELTRYALATDFSLPVTTFFGRSPNDPEPAWLNNR